MNDLFTVVNKSFAIEAKKAYLDSKNLFPTQAQEIQGIAALLGIPEEDVFFYEFIYEVYIACTTIISRDSKNRVFVGRNLFDYMFLTDLAKTHYLAIYTLKGVESFRCTNYGGYIGVNTCLKKGKFVVTLNSRSSLFESSYRQS